MRAVYPPEIHEYICSRSWHVTAGDMAAQVNKKFGTAYTGGQIKSFRERNHVISGTAGWYMKGRAPANKGKKLEEVVGAKRAEEIRNSISQRRKKEGAMNKSPLGTVVIRCGYRFQKRSMTGSWGEQWGYVHRMVWEKANGPIPEGMVVSFRDGNRLNCRLENLMLITRRESACMNMMGLRSEDPKLTEAGLNTVRLKNAIVDQKKGREKHESKC